MILILSTERGDISTEDIIDWLDYYDAPYMKLNGEDFDGNNSFKITINNNKIEAKIHLEEKVLHSSSVKVVWFRRWNSFDKLVFITRNASLSKELSLRLKTHLMKETQITSFAFFEIIKNAKWLDSYEKSFGLNKLNVLMLAAKVGLKIPNTIISSDTKEMAIFINQNQEAITKTIGEITSFNSNNKDYYFKTCLVNQSNLLINENQNEGDEFTFYSSLLQERIEKKIELRVFYLDGEFYAMAIFSQKNERTRVDFRNYDFENPNRYVPYKLPQSVESNLTKLMELLSLKQGSIDLIKDKNNNYIFLEVNPVGQFGMTSIPCNYHLEKKVAKLLIKYEKQ